MQFGLFSWDSSVEELLSELAMNTSGVVNQSYEFTKS